MPRILASSVVLSLAVILHLLFPVAHQEFPG
jgi:hypothetical protein